MKKILSVLLLFVSICTSAQIQFTEVNPVTQTITIKNFGGSALDISGYRLCSLFDYTFSGMASSPDVSVLSGSFNLEAGASVTITWAASSGFPPTAADLNLYLPFGGFNNPANMVCFMQYGSGGNGREPEAVSAGLWAAGTFITGPAPYVYTGNGTQSGVQYWQATQPPATNIVINEIDSDTPGTDMMEFVELYGAPNEALDGMVLVFFNGNNDLSYQSIDLDGFTCNSEGFFLIGNAGVAGASVNFNNNTLQNGADAVALYWGNGSDWPTNTPISTNNLIDAVVYDTGQTTDSGLMALLLSGPQVNEAGAGSVTDHSLSRLPDGGAQRSTLTYVAQQPTPGYTNVFPVCDGGTVLTDQGAAEVTVCVDGNADEVFFTHSTGQPDAQYVYVVTNQSNQIIQFPAGLSQDFNNYSVGVYRVFGVSYYGSIVPSTVEPGDPVGSIESTGFCVQLSSNYINIIVLECGVIPECENLFISEYIEGLGNNKALEIYNPTNFPVNLGAYLLKNYANGSTQASNIFGLSGTLQPGQAYVVANPNANEAILNVANATASVALFNGNDAIVLEHNNVPIDIIGQVGINPGTGGWPVSTGSTTDHVLVRKPNVTAPTADWNLSSSLQWDVYPPNEFSYLGSHFALPCGITMPQITFAQSAVGVHEEDGSVTVYINVFNPANDVQVSVAAADGSALAGEEYNPAQFPILVNFPQGSTAPQPVTIEILDDDVMEPLEYFTLQMSVVQGPANIIQSFMNIIILKSDTYYPVYEIAQVTTQNNEGVCDSLDVNCELRGIVHGINFNSAGVNFTLIDHTDGISVFKALDNLGYTVSEGDSVHVKGVVYQFMGLTSFEPDFIQLIDSGHELETPQVVTSLNEDTESHMVRVECVALVNPAQWINAGNGFNVDVTDGVNTFQLRIDGDSDLFGTEPPAGHFSVTGIGGQFDSTLPYTSGYQMWPRYLDDFDNEVIALFTSDGGSTLQYDALPVSVQFTSQSAGAISYNWNFGDGSTSTQTNPQHTYQVNFLSSVSTVTVTLTVTNGSGCSDTFSFTFNVQFVNVEEAHDTALSLYPNPASETAVLVSHELLSGVSIADATGKEIMVCAGMNQNQWQLDLSGCAPGLYFVTVFAGEKTRVLRLVKS